MAEPVLPTFVNEVEGWEFRGMLPDMADVAPFSAIEDVAQYLSVALPALDFSRLTECVVFLFEHSGVDVPLVVLDALVHIALLAPEVESLRVARFLVFHCSRELSSWAILCSYGLWRIPCVAEVVVDCMVWSRPSPEESPLWDQLKGIAEHEQVLSSSASYMASISPVQIVVLELMKRLNGSRVCRIEFEVAEHELMFDDLSMLSIHEKDPAIGLAEFLRRSGLAYSAWNVLSAEDVANLAIAIVKCSDPDVIYRGLQSPAMLCMFKRTLNGKAFATGRMVSVFTNPSYYVPEGMISDLAKWRSDAVYPAFEWGMLCECYASEEFKDPSSPGVMWDTSKTSRLVRTFMSEVDFHTLLATMVSVLGWKGLPAQVDDEMLLNAMRTLDPAIAGEGDVAVLESIMSIAWHMPNSECAFWDMRCRRSEPSLLVTDDEASVAIDKAEIALRRAFLKHPISMARHVDTVLGVGDQAFRALFENNGMPTKVRVSTVAFTALLRVACDFAGGRIMSDAELESLGRLAVKVIDSSLPYMCAANKFMEYFDPLMRIACRVFTDLWKFDVGAMNNDVNKSLDLVTSIVSKIFEVDETHKDGPGLRATLVVTVSKGEASPLTLAAMRTVADTLADA